MLIKQFKKDYLSYFLGILIPALASFLTIPFLKNLLGTSDFGVYTYYVSILLIINASFSGGISQSIIRLHIDFTNKKVFYNESLWVTLITSLILSIPLLVYIQGSLKILSFSVLYIATIFLANIYTSLLAITQSRFLSAASAIGEGIRTIIFLALSFILLHFFAEPHYLILLFSALCLSYFLASAFLFFKNDISIGKHRFQLSNIIRTAKLIWQYGSYLIGWFFCSFGISMSNRFVLANYFGKENIGHFTASFDILNRSIVLLLSPVLLSLFPLVIKAYGEEQFQSVKALIKKLLYIEVGLLIVTLIAFPLIGFPVISKLLNTPQTKQYLLIDLQIIASCFVWQLGMLQHKYLELEKKTSVMLGLIFIAFVISLSIDILLISNLGATYACIGYLSGGIVYYILVSFYSQKKLTPFKSINTFYETAG